MRETATNGRASQRPRVGVLFSPASPSARRKVLLSRPICPNRPSCPSNFSRVAVTGTPVGSWSIVSPAVHDPNQPYCFRLLFSQSPAIPKIPNFSPCAIRWDCGIIYVVKPKEGTTPDLRRERMIFDIGGRKKFARHRAGRV